MSIKVYTDSRGVEEIFYQQLSNFFNLPPVELISRPGATLDRIAVNIAQDANAALVQYSP